MKNSLKKRILEHYKVQSCWIHKGTIETLAKNGFFGKPKENAVGYLGETADRRLRELQNEGELEYDTQREGWYRAKNPYRYEYLRVVGTDQIIKRVIKQHEYI